MIIYIFKLLKKLIIINMCNLYLHLLFSYFCMSTTIYKCPGKNNFNLVYLSFNEDFWRISLKHFGNETNSPSSLKELQKKRMIVMKYISNCKFITLHTYIHTYIYVCMYVCSVINLQFEMYFITIILFFCNSFKLEGLFVSFPKCLREIRQKSSLKDK